MIGWWFGTFFMFPHYLGRIIPTDFHNFSKGVKPPTRWVKSITRPSIQVGHLSLWHLSTVGTHHLWDQKAQGRRVPLRMESKCTQERLTRWAKGGPAAGLRSRTLHPSMWGWLTRLGTWYLLEDNLGGGTDGSGIVEILQTSTVLPTWLANRRAFQNWTWCLVGQSRVGTLATGRRGWSDQHVQRDAFNGLISSNCLTELEHVWKITMSNGKNWL